MAISLYDTSVTAYLQTLSAASRFMDKGLTHCRERGIDPQEIVETRFYADMQPFRFQIQSMVHHAVGTVEAFTSGVFRPSAGSQVTDYTALQSQLTAAQEMLQKLTPEEINAREGAELIFQTGDLKLKFKAEDFVLSFSLPNFHFHATTAYDILRSKGVPLGKRDYLGRLRFQR
ncbi:MAG TPA: DUF1993 domain-containing protein [Polyangiales bacterium]|nr:DUF1993 domain-containing protein [Polyangiales bacterium]